MGGVVYFDWRVQITVIFLYKSSRQAFHALPLTTNCPRFQIIPGVWAGKPDSLRGAALDQALETGRVSKASNPGAATAAEHARTLLALRDALLAWGPEAGRDLLLEAMANGTGVHRLRRQNTSFDQVGVG